MIVPNYWWLSRGTAMLIASILLVWSIVAGRLMNTHTNGNDLYYRLCHVQARLRHVTCKVIITWYVNDDWSYLSFPYSIWKSLWLSEFCVLGTKIQNRLTFLVTSTFLSFEVFKLELGQRVMSDVFVCISTTSSLQPYYSMPTYRNLSFVIWFISYCAYFKTSNCVVIFLFS